MGHGAPVVCLMGARDSRRGLVGDGVRTAAKVSDGEGSPVRDWWREMADVLHGIKTKLTRGL